VPGVGAAAEQGGALMAEKHSGVYFIRRSGDGAIKIGYSGDVGRRISALQTGCPDALTLAGLMVGGTKADEWNLHQQFRAAAISGEWFRPTPELIGYVEHHPAPEYFNEDRLRSRLRRRISDICDVSGDGLYRGVAPPSLSEVRIPCRIPVKRGAHRLAVLLEWATAQDLASCQRILRSRADAAMARASRAYPARAQTDDPAIARFIEFMCVWRPVAPVLEAAPEWHAGDALRYLTQQETQA
jgi:hypothetical protein